MYTTKTNLRKIPKPNIKYQKNSKLNSSLTSKVIKMGGEYYIMKFSVSNL